MTIEKNKGGRPTKYTPELGEQFLDWMAKGYSMSGACGKIGISRTRLYDWMEKHPEFKQAVDDGRSARTAFLEEGLIEATTGPLVTARTVALKLSKDPDWQEITKTEITGKDGGPVAVDVSGLTDAQLEALNALYEGLDK